MQVFSCDLLDLYSGSAVCEGNPLNAPSQELHLCLEGLESRPETFCLHGRSPAARDYRALCRGCGLHSRRDRAGEKEQLHDANIDRTFLH